MRLTIDDKTHVERLGIICLHYAKNGGEGINGCKQHANHMGELLSLRKKPTIHQITIMLAPSKNVLFPGRNHLLANGTDDPSL